VGTDLYPHMPILRPHAVQYSTNGASLLWHLRRRIFTCRWAWPPCWTNRPARGQCVALQTSVHGSRAGRFV